MVSGFAALGKENPTNRVRRQCALQKFPGWWFALALVLSNSWALAQAPAQPSPPPSVVVSNFVTVTNFVTTINVSTLTNVIVLTNFVMVTNDVPSFSADAPESVRSWVAAIFGAFILAVLGAPRRWAVRRVLGFAWGWQKAPLLAFAIMLVASGILIYSASGGTKTFWDYFQVVTGMAEPLPEWGKRVSKKEDWPAEWKDAVGKLNH